MVVFFYLGGVEMCLYCEKGKDIGRFDLDNEDEMFVYINIKEGEMKFYIESTCIDDECSISAKYCPMCVGKLEGR